MTFHIITIFPEIFNSYLSEGILKRAQEKGKIGIKLYNLRDFTTDKHRTVDDTPYGGGPGMVLKIEPIHRCIEEIRSKSKNKRSKMFIALTSAKGEEYSQEKAEELKKYSDLIIICGRYEGVDERVALCLADKELSIGKYVLTGGELPAMVIVDSVTRLLPGVLGNKESLTSESHQRILIDEFSNPKKNIIDTKMPIEIRQVKTIKDYPVYTKPEEYKGWRVPDVLLSGNHAEIEKWRIENSRN